MVTPISPHTMRDRSILFAPEDEVEIRVGSARGNKIQYVEAIFDGSHKVPLKTGDKVLIRESDKRTKIIKLTKESFLMTLQKKLKD